MHTVSTPSLSAVSGQMAWRNSSLRTTRPGCAMSMRSTAKLLGRRPVAALLTQPGKGGVEDFIRDHLGAVQAPLGLECTARHDGWRHGSCHLFPARELSQPLTPHQRLSVHKCRNQCPWPDVRRALCMHSPVLPARCADTRYLQCQTRSSPRALLGVGTASPA